MTKQRLLLFIISFLTLSFAFEAVTPVLATTETRYMTSTRSDLVTTPLLYVLSTTQTGSGAQVLGAQYDGNVYVTQYFGVRVYLNHSDKTLTEITSGVTTITSGNTTGIVSGTWNCPQTTMVSTDKVQVRVYLSDANPPVNGMAQFVTEQLSTTILNSATWTIYFYLGRQYVARPIPLTKYSFWFGSATYNSRIEGFKYGESSANAYVADLSKALTSTWTLATLTNYRIVPTQTLTSSWSILTSQGMTATFTQSLESTWQLITQSTFNVDFTRDMATSWQVIIHGDFLNDLSESLSSTCNVLTQTNFQITLSLDAISSWLVNLIQGHAAQNFVADLSQSLTSTWQIITQTNYQNTLSADLVATWQIVTNTSFQTNFNLDVVSSWLVDVGQGIAYTVDLSLNIVTSWLVDVTGGVMEFDLAIMLALTVTGFIITGFIVKARKKREED